MDVVTDLDLVPNHLRGGVVVLGNFDGVHRGHQAVISLAKSLAKNHGVPTGVITFHPHPRLFFAPENHFFRLTPKPLKLRLLKRIGVDVAFIVPFDAALAALTPGEFVKQVLSDRIGACHVIAGWDYRFGTKRQGNADILKDLGQENGMEVTIVKPQGSLGGVVYSSTRIRKLLQEGNLDEAVSMLGYRWRLASTVIEGDRRGRDLGFPTINMTLDPGLTLAHGIYAVRAHVDDKVYGGAAYYGSRPTFQGTEPFLETFLFNFEGDLYGRQVEIEFAGFLRPDCSFEDELELREQIDRDCEQARKCLAELGVGDLLA